jgi:hypothetical protein
MVLDQKVVDRFRSLENELATKFPDARIEAEALGRGIADPRAANADAIWTKVWDKPLFANTKVAIGKAMTEKLGPYMAQAWQHWGADEAEFKIRKIAKGSSSAAFEAVTYLAKKIRQDTNIAMHRLFAIQGAAGALRNRNKKSAAPYADLVDYDPGDLVPMVQREMGSGWGHITVLHFLTDLGLACKPDLHLVRTVRHLGMALDLRDRKVPSLADSIMINRRVRSLVESLDGSFDPARLRYVDKTLMDISMRGLIREEVPSNT